MVVFAHGSGSSVLSPRGVAVADRLNRAGLNVAARSPTPQEAADRSRVFDIGLQASRLVAAARLVDSLPELAEFPLAFFGASTGAGAALVAAATLGDEVTEVVSRGGRPDVAGDALEQVTAPTLLIVGGEDHQVLDLNRAATRRVARGDADRRDLGGGPRSGSAIAPRAFGPARPGTVQRMIHVGTSGWQYKDWRDVWAFFNNDHGGAAVRDALFLRDLLARSRARVA
ncbi:MAG: hypothetical protein WD965_08705 [Actinomycetota bacterium]